MAHTPRITAAVANSMMDAAYVTGNPIGGGKLRIYQGTQPAAGGGSAAGSTLLATLTMNATAFGASANGIVTANAITSDTNAASDGTAQWFRLMDSSETTTYLDGSVGTVAANTEDLQLNATSVTAGGTVAVTSFTITHPLL